MNNNIPRESYNADELQSASVENANRNAFSHADNYVSEGNKPFPSGDGLPFLKTDFKDQRSLDNYESIYGSNGTNTPATNPVFAYGGNASVAK